jgi:hypothetical protein
MRCRFFIFLSLLSVSFYSHPANAGPDQTTDWLMDEKASIFDLGMMKLGTRLEGIEESWPAGFSKPIVSYQWDEDVIKIFVFSLLEIKSVKVAKDGCREAFDSVRRSAGVNKENGGLLFEFNNTFFSDLFSHTGYVVGGSKEQDQRLKALDKKFNLACSVRTKEGKTIEGFSPLLSKGAYFKD